MDLIDFIQQTNVLDDKEALTESFLRFLQGFGIDRFIMGELSHDGTARKEEFMALMVNYPPEWMAHYINQHYVDHDPVYQKALVAQKPFTWQEVEADKNLTKKARQVMDEARENKLHGGIGLSIYRPFGGIIGMGFAGSEKGVRCDKDAVSMIYAGANQFFTVYADITGFDDLRSSDVTLTAREQEVLQWLARGKKKGDVADILSISLSTTKRYCESIFAKLNVSSTQAAVAKALRMGLIHPF